ncbi:MAG: hypothetical protein OXN89_10915 [Bryobacterales bacterium]|nr:hypothetical protein [Bryobacterales bacterium]
MAKPRHAQEEVIALYAGGDLGRWKRFLTDRHLSKCAVCRQSAADYRRARQDLAALRETPPVDFKALTRHVQAAATARQNRAARGQRGRWLLGTAACAATVALALLYTGSQVRSPQPEVPSAGLGMQATWGETLLGLDAADAQVGATGELRFRAYDAASGTLSITEYY